MNNQDLENILYVLRDILATLRYIEETNREMLRRMR
jgi:hypothetical protein